MKTTLIRAAFATATAASVLVSLPTAAFATETPSGGVACPVNTTPTAFEQFSVLPNGQTASSSVLVSGRTYLVQATGTYAFAPSWLPGAGIADAAYSLRASGYNNASTAPEWIDGAVFSSPYQNWLELWINNSAVAWGAFNPAHVYTTSVVGAGTALGFSILDDVYSDNSGSLTVTLTACVPVATHTLVYVAGGHGSITGTSPQTVNHGASGTAVTAVPDTGYHFVRWSDGSTQNPRTDTNVTADLSVTAQFKANDVPPPPPVGNKNACKKGGWAMMEDDQDTSFRNQGDCVSYFATGGKNKAKGKK